MNINYEVKKYIDRYKIGDPIFIKDVFDYFNKKNLVNYEKIINVYINRLKNDVALYKKGIYYRYVKTSFGKSSINVDKVINRYCLLNKDEKIIGYETGPSLFNKLGLSTQSSSKIYIVTNNNRNTIINKNNIEMIKPKMLINNNNYAYFQFLDILENKYNANIDVNKNEYYDILIKYMNKNKIEEKNIFKFLSLYKNKSLLIDKIAEVEEYKNESTSR